MNTKSIRRRLGYALSASLLLALITIDTIHAAGVVGMVVLP